jgi:outer membrane receptor protein involved in Fe transport
MKGFFLILIIILFSSNNIFSQSTVEGKVVDSLNNPIEYAEIILLSIDSIALKSELSNVEGKFKIEIKKDNYILQIRQIGQILYSKIITIEKNIDLGLIKIKESQQVLNEITLTSKKKILERKTDRLIFNIENSIAALNGDAIDALTVTPGLRIQGESIGIIGKNNIDIMINNKKIQLSGNDLLTYLKAIRSENISKIEVITNPSAKYDSEGNIGLINIILKNNSTKGLNGSIQSSQNKGNYWNFNNGLNLNYQNNNLKISWKGNLSNIKNNALEYNKIENTSQSIENNINRNFYGNNFSSYLDINYSLNTNSNFGIVYNISNRNTKGKGITNSSIRSSIFQNVVSTTDSDYEALANNLNGYYVYKFGKEKKVSIEGNYITNLVDNITNNYSSFNYNNLNNSKQNDYKIKTFQVDFELPNKWCKIETGSKFTNTDSNNFINSTENAIINLSNNFSLNEKISAIYYTANREISEKWIFDFGLRYEYTQLTLLPQTINQININYDNAFPVINLLFKQNEKISWSLNYNKRINRPKYEDLNPNIFYNNSYSYTTGNPFLKPTISHNIELNFTKNDLNLTFYGSKLLNGSGSINSIEDDFQVSKIQNYYDSNSFGFNLNYSYKIFKIWETTFYADTNYENSTSSILQASSFNGWNGYLSTNNSFILNKNKSLIFFTNFWQTTKTRIDFRAIQPNANLSLGIRYSMFNKKLNFSFTIRDALKQEYKKGVSITENGTNTYNNYYDARRFIFSLNYKFGNKKIKSNQKNINNEEQNRSVKE